MSLWIDFLGADIRTLSVPGFGRVRIAEAGKGNSDAVVFLHGVGGHLEAYAKNVVPLSKHFHVIALDFVGHGLSDKNVPEFSPQILAEQVREVLDVLNIRRAHISGESLGGWVAGVFATRYPERTQRLLLNTAGGIPIISQKGLKDLQDLIELTKRNANHTPTYESVQARMRWLMHEKNWPLLTQELIETRLRFYLDPELAKAKPAIGKFFMQGPDVGLIELEKIQAETLFLWTRDNPIHDLEAAQAAWPRVPHAHFYVMEADAMHWPQYEAPEEFNRVAEQFLLTGNPQVGGAS
jgi:HOMODA hydrolase